VKHPFYLLYALVVLACTGIAELRGWTFTSPQEMRDVPRSIRDNPGAYRSHYGGYTRYLGGK
jgi:hypothetical protein